MKSFQIHTDETLNSFIQKYPLTVQYFQEEGLSPDSFDLTLREYQNRNNINADTLEKELLSHLAGISRPESSDCRLLCFSNLFCTKKRIYALGLSLVTLALLLFFLYP